MHNRLKDSWRQEHIPRRSVQSFSISVCSVLYHAPLHSNETSWHWQEGQFCRLLHEKRGLLEGLPGDEKGGQHWSNTVICSTWIVETGPLLFIGHDQCQRRVGTCRGVDSHPRWQKERALQPIPDNLPAPSSTGRTSRERLHLQATARSGISVRARPWPPFVSEAGQVCGAHASLLLRAEDMTGHRLASTD